MKSFINIYSMKIKIYIHTPISFFVDFQSDPNGRQKIKPIKFVYTSTKFVPCGETKFLLAPNIH